MKNNNQRLLCLDFDGVLCDSVAETAASGWKAGRRIWPTEWLATEPPEAALNAFRRLRPLLHTGFESVLLMRIACLKPDISIPNETEIQVLYNSVLASSGLTREQLAHTFAETRDEWIAADPRDWRSRQSLYPGIADALKSALSTTIYSIHIVTTKQERFVRELLNTDGITELDNRIHGLESGANKEITLQTIAASHDISRRPLVVEDRLPTLQTIATTPELDSFDLFYADWGYGHPTDSDIIARQNRIRTVSLGQFIKLLTSGKQPFDCAKGESVK